MIFGLIGGADIKKYTIADIMWEKISELSGVKFDFKVIPIENFTELCRFYWNYAENPEFLGFNVALPWKTEIINLVDCVDSDSKIFCSINTVYKNDCVVHSSNTDVIGIEKALLKSTKLNSQDVLIIGAGGAGLPTAIYLMQKYDCRVYVYDIKDIAVNVNGVTILKNYSDMKKRKYDIIINATPIGKFYLNEVPTKFSSPLSIDLLKEIAHDQSLIQEMNYLPVKTEILKYGLLYDLRVISGVDMLVYQALASFKLYTGLEFDNIKTVELIGYLNNYSKNKEYELLR